MDLLADLKAGVREFFLLESAKRRFEARTPAQRAFVSEHLRAARRRLRFVPRLIDVNTAPMALTMVRDAVVLLTRAVHASRSAAAEFSLETPVDAAQELTQLFGEDAFAPPDWRKMLPFLAAGDLLAMDRLPIAEQLSLLTTFTETAQRLDACIESTSTAKLWAMRVGRIAAALVLFAVVVIRAASAPNLALYKATRQSSYLPIAPPSSVLVDGKTSGSHSPGTENADVAHTNFETGTTPWLMVDLGAVHELKEVRVYNRADTHFNDTLPCKLEISTDGATFETIAERKKHFGSSWFDRPWVVKILGGRTARFVRVTGTRYLVLSEIEVYGR